MSFKPMDPAMIRELLEGQEDVITPAAAMEAEIFKAARCPACGSKGAEKTIEPPQIVQEEDGDEIVLRAPFQDGSPLVSGHAKCLSCKTEFSPTTGVIIKNDAPALTGMDFTDE